MIVGWGVGLRVVLNTMWDSVTLQFHLHETPDAIRTSSPPLYFDFTPRLAGSLHSSFVNIPLFMDTSALAAPSWSEPRVHISREDSSRAHFIESVSATMPRGILSVFSSDLCRRCCATAVTTCDLLQVFAAWPVEGCTHNGLLADALDGTSTAAVLGWIMMHMVSMFFELRCHAADRRSSCVRAFWQREQQQQQQQRSKRNEAPALVDIQDVWSRMDWAWYTHASCRRYRRR
jgi:hypothetical protein